MVDKTKLTEDVVETPDEAPLPAPETEEVPADAPPEGLSLTVVPVTPNDGRRSMQGATLVAAFDTLAAALMVLLEDNIPAQAHLEEVMGWHANGNVAVSWQHVIQLLEQVLDAKLTV